MSELEQKVQVLTDKVEELGDKVEELGTKVVNIQENDIAHLDEKVDDVAVEQRNQGNLIWQMWGSLSSVNGKLKVMIPLSLVVLAGIITIVVAVFSN